MIEHEQYGAPGLNRRPSETDESALLADTDPNLGTPNSTYASFSSRPTSAAFPTKSLSRKRQVNLNLELPTSLRQSTVSKTSSQPNNTGLFNELAGLNTTSEASPHGNVIYDSTNVTNDGLPNKDPFAIRNTNLAPGFHRFNGTAMEAGPTNLFGPINPETHPPLDIGPTASVHLTNTSFGAGDSGAPYNFDPIEPPDFTDPPRLLSRATNPTNPLNLERGLHVFGQTFSGSYPPNFNSVDAVNPAEANAIGYNRNVSSSSHPVDLSAQPAQIGGSAYIAPPVALPPRLDNNQPLVEPPNVTNGSLFWRFPTRRADMVQMVPTSDFPASQPHSDKQHYSSKASDTVTKRNRERPDGPHALEGPRALDDPWMALAKTSPPLPGKRIYPTGVLSEEKETQRSREDSPLKVRGYVYKLSLPRRRRKVPSFYFNSQTPNGFKVMFSSIPYMLLNPSVFRKFVIEWHMRPNTTVLIDNFLRSNGIGNVDVFQKSLGINVAPLKQDLDVSTLYTPLNPLASSSILFQWGDGGHKCPYPDCHSFNGHFENLCSFACHLNACHPRSVNCPVCHDLFTRKDSAKRHISRKHNESEHSATRDRASKKLQFLASRNFAVLPEGWEGRLREKYFGEIEFLSRKKQTDLVRSAAQREKLSDDDPLQCDAWVTFKKREEEYNYDLNLFRILSGTKSSYRDYNTSDAMFT